MKQKLIYWLPFLLLVGCSQPTYKTTSLAPEKRAELLLKELTLEEKVALMMDNSQAVERLGIKPYNWWNEALHGVARAGLATVFPQPIGMAASFSPESVYEVFSAVSDEARAKNANYASQGSYARYQGRQAACLCEALRRTLRTRVEPPLFQRRGPQRARFV